MAACFVYSSGAPDADFCPNEITLRSLIIWLIHLSAAWPSLPLKAGLSFSYRSRPRAPRTATKSWRYSPGPAQKSNPARVTAPFPSRCVRISASFATSSKVLGGESGSRPAALKADRLKASGLGAITSGYAYTALLYSTAGTIALAASFESLSGVTPNLARSRNAPCEANGGTQPTPVTRTSYG